MSGTKHTDRAALEAAVAASYLANMSPSARGAMLSRGRIIKVVSKAQFVRSGEAPRCGLVIKGLVRTVRVSGDGRELTLHWARAGEIMGLTTAVQGPAPTTIQAVTDSLLLELPVPLVAQLGGTDPTVGWAIAQYATGLLRRAIDEIMLYAYGGLRARIERRLLEFACLTAPGTPLIAQLSQEELALAVGAARPSVARVLKELRAEDSIRPMYGSVLILRPEALAHDPASDVA